jgi:zinc D-Ala-D-Ala dipeptidase
VRLAMTTFVVAALLALPELADVTKLDARFVLDIRYATTENFTGKKLYPVGRCLLRPEVGDMVLAAQHYLDARHPGFVLMFKDCYRPASIQFVLWQAVVGTPMQGYVADPNGKTGSVHTYGAAVDLTLAKDGKEVDMGTPYDHLGPLAEPRHEQRFVSEGKLSRVQVNDRKKLRDAMVHAGFHVIDHEWWHFDALQGAALRKRYDKLDVGLEAVP